MANSHKLETNKGLLLYILVGCWLLYVSVSHYNAAVERHEYGLPFQNGLLAEAKIVSIEDTAQGGVDTAVRFTDHQGEVRDAFVWLQHPGNFRAGQSLQISYEREDPYYIRVPSSEVTTPGFAGGRAFYFVWIILSLCVFPYALWSRFREPVENVLNTNELTTDYRVKKNYFQLMLNWSVCALILIPLYLLAMEVIAQVSVSSVFYQGVLLFALHAVLVWKIGLPVLRVLLNDPLIVSRSGLSIYGSRPVAWDDISQIKIFTNRQYREKSLVIGLNTSSAATRSVWWHMGLRDMRPYVFLLLNGTYYDIDHIITAINYFGLEAHDPVAAKQFFESSTETGIIQAHRGLKAAALEAQNNPVYDNQEQQENTASETQALQPEGDYYMGGGFHSGRR